MNMDRCNPKRVRREGSMLDGKVKVQSIFDISNDEEVRNSGSILSPNQKTMGLAIDLMDLSQDDEIVNSASPHMTLGVLNDADVSEQLIFTPDGHVGTGALHEY